MTHIRTNALINLSLVSLFSARSFHRLFKEDNADLAIPSLERVSTLQTIIIIIIIIIIIE